jgi:hypothetical protein
MLTRLKVAWKAKVQCRRRWNFKPIEALMPPGDSGDASSQKERRVQKKKQVRAGHRHAKTNSKVLTKLLILLQGFLLSNLETSSGLGTELIVVEVGCARHGDC